MNEDENLDNFNKVSSRLTCTTCIFISPLLYFLNVAKIEQQKLFKISIKFLRMYFKQMYNSKFQATFLINSCHVWCQRNNILTQKDARDLMLLTVFQMRFYLNLENIVGTF